MGKHTDIPRGKTTTYTYDLLDRLVKSEVSSEERIEYRYNNLDQTSKVAYTVGGVRKETGYTYRKAGMPENTTYPNGAVKNHTLNGLAQVGNTTLTLPGGKTWKTDLWYYTPPSENGVNFVTNAIGKLVLNGAGKTLTYTYDGSGNIATISENFVQKQKFQYDELNQLTRADDANTNETVTYQYDAGGNLTQKKKYAYTTGTLGPVLETVDYSYENAEWKDLLTSYNGQAITYDAIGNPLTYRDGLEFSWERGRQLTKVKREGSVVASYTYDASGRRVKKETGEGTREYLYSGGMLAYEKVGEDGLAYLQDETGRMYGVRRWDKSEGKTLLYYYVYNLQGDVIGLYDQNGNYAARYSYDSWGMPTGVSDGSGNAVTDANHIANLNPFRYRGYYYDTETGLYYLQSRYYDPVVGRFVNADGLISTGRGFIGTNMFAYCLNNPANLVDPYGNCPYNGTIADFHRLDHGLPSLDCTCDSYVVPGYSDDSGKIAVGPIGGVEIHGSYGKINGWDYRIDNADTTTGVKKHIHIFQGKKIYSQCVDGQPHDGSTGSPPNSVKKVLKKNGVWDWDKKAKQYENAQNAMELPTDLSNDPLYRFFVIPGPTPVPSPAPVPTPAPNPFTLPIPAY